MNEDNRYRLHHRNRTYPDRRAQKRNLCSDLIQVRWKSAEGARHEEIAIMEDYSPSGASLFMGVPIERGTQVRLSPKGEDLLGVVRYCSVGPNGYLVGVHFEPVTEDDDPDRSEFHPEHMLDVSRLDFSVDD